MRKLQSHNEENYFFFPTCVCTGPDFVCFITVAVPFFITTKMCCKSSYIMFQALKMSPNKICMLEYHECDHDQDRQKKK